VRMAWAACLLVAGVASAVALLLQNVLRATWQIRGLPERVMEWLLLFVPLDVFERGLAQFGASAKELALLGITFGMAAVLLATGTLVLRSGWSSYRLLVLGGALWLVAMAVIMPVTGAGFFATRLLTSPVLVAAGYFVVFVGYASILIGGRLLAAAPVEDRPSMLADRRAVLFGIGGTLAASAAARYVGRDGGLLASSLPHAVATPLPTIAPTVSPRATSQPAAPTAPGPTPVSMPEPLPNPALPRALKRDQDGSLTAAGRPRGQLTPPITSNADFYIVTKNAAGDPLVDADSWRLIVDGEVNRPVQLNYRTLVALPAVEITKTLECVSNLTSGCNLTVFGCDLISTARWKGARLSDIVALAGGLKPGAVGLAFTSLDEFSAGLPATVVLDPETLIVYEMNGEPLPREHGFPARLLVPGRYGMKDPKWLAGIRATTADHSGWYEQRNWSADGVVKTMSRIDLPLDGSNLTPGEHRLAGIAYAGDRGVNKVEFTIDDGETWELARLLDPLAGKDAMVRWAGTFFIGRDETLRITVRATDGSGEIQTNEYKLPQPDGASGRDAISVVAA
jgi:DMSO/TMAO reductase YedYZ molybdopterin-dependent catalytic subunit